MEAKTILTLISTLVALVSLLVTIGLARDGRRAARETQAELQRYQRDLKRLDDELASSRSERDARRDYEYEALKRLYHECAPLRFQLTDQAGQLLSRLTGLAMTARAGDLDGGNSWLSGTSERYYRRSTEYRLLAPLATYKLLHARLTHLDLSLDPELRVLYQLARSLARALGDDFEIARTGSVALPYDPHAGVSDQSRQSDPAKYVQQGIPRGILENAIEALIVREGDISRVLTFLEFEAALDERTEPVRSAIQRIRYLIVDFHPGNKPILWRVLLVMALIAQAIQRWADQGSKKTLTFEELFAETEAQRKQLDWRAAGDTRGEAPDQSLTAAHAYLERYVRPQIQPLLAENFSTAP